MAYMAAFLQSPSLRLAVGREPFRFGKAPLELFAEYRRAG
jgi:hypothetical protein